jgi:hypothetical protein
LTPLFTIKTGRALALAIPFVTLSDAKTMEANTQLNERRLADAWAELHAHTTNGNPLQADAYRLAFADPEFLFRRETRGIRFQLEMLKPDLGRPSRH